MTLLPENAAAAFDDQRWWRYRAMWVYDSIVAGHMDDAAESMGPYEMAVEHLGSVRLPDGCLTACDPRIVGEDPEPFADVFPVGEATALAARAVDADGDDRVAALMLRWCAGPITEWRMATDGDRDVATLEDGAYFAYGVDSGTGAFGSPEAMAHAIRVMTDYKGSLADPVSAAFGAGLVNAWAAFALPPAPGVDPVAVCHTADGDGAYPTWLGLDAEGTVVVAFTDFFQAKDPRSLELDY